MERVAAKLAPLALFLALAVCGCDDTRRDVSKQKEAKEKAARNECESDEACAPTGCWGTVCAAAPDLGFCPHRLILEARPGLKPSPEHVLSARRWLESKLTKKEAESLQVDSVGDAILISFHASKETRKQVVDGLRALEPGGFYVPLDAVEKSGAALEALLAAQIVGVKRSPQISAGGHEVWTLEVPVPGGDIVTQEEIAAVRRGVVDLFPPDGPNERKVVEIQHDGTHFLLRIWWIDPQPRPSFASVTDIEPQANGTAKLRFDEPGAKAFLGLTTERTSKHVVVAIGDDVILAPVVREAISAGDTFLVYSPIEWLAEIQRERVQRLSLFPRLASDFSFSDERTEDAEKSLACYRQTPALAACSCVEGKCAWKDDEPLKACISSRD